MKKSVVRSALVILLVLTMVGTSACGKLPFGPRGEASGSETSADSQKDEISQNDSSRETSTETGTESGTESTESGGNDSSEETSVETGTESSTESGTESTELSGNESSEESSESGDTEIQITLTEASQIEYEVFDNGMVSLEIPKGWKVDAPYVGFASYTFKVYDPDDANYMFLFGLKLTGFMKTEEAREAFASIYPDSLFGRLAAIDPMTTEKFFSVWNQNVQIVNEEQLRYPYFPFLNDFTVIENLGQLSIGGDILGATFENDKGEPMQGLFTTSLFSPGSYYMYGYDMMPLSAYHNILMMAPDAEFNNWSSIMSHCLETIQFSPAFMEGFYREEENMVALVQANAKIYDEIADMIMDSWNRRSYSYDIMSQKQSDATLGYERVYNTETGEVYLAYLGFLDEYSGTLYQSVTDEMYILAITGYIGK